MGRGRDQWPAVVAGTARSTTCVNQTRAKPASQGRARPASTRTTTDKARGVVAPTPAGYALSGAPSGADTHGASQSNLWTVVSTDRSVYRDAAQAAATTVTTVAG